MKKEFIKIGVALLLLLGLAIPLSLHRQKELEKNIAADDGLKFVSFNPTLMARIVVKSKNGEVTLERRKKNKDGEFEDEFQSRAFEYQKNPEWIVTKPYRALADFMLMDSFFGQVNGLAHEKVIQENQDRKKDYDLDPAIFSIQFFDEGSQEPKLVLNMGSENPAATGYYFTSSNKPGIYLGGRELQPYNDQRLTAWRENKILGIPQPGNIESLKAEYSLKKQDSFEAAIDNDVWKLGKFSENLPADREAIFNYGIQVDGMRAGQIIDDQSVIKNNKLFGKITLKIKNQKNPIVYSIFNDPKNANQRYMQRSDLKEIFVVEKEGYLTPTFQQIVNKKFMENGMDQMSSLKVIRTGYNLEISKIEDSWKIQKPYQDDANPRRIESFIKAIQEAHAVSYLPNKTLNSNNQVIRAEFGFLDQKKGSVSFYNEGNRFYAKVEDSYKPRVLEVSQMPTDLYEHLSHLRNDDLVPVSDEHVKRIVFTRKDKTKIEVEQNIKKSLWSLKFLENVSSTVRMKWKEEVTPAEFFDRTMEMYIVNFNKEIDPLEKYDMATLDIFTDDNKQFTWKFGEKKGELVPVFSPDRKVSGTMAWSRYEDLNSMLDEPKKSTK